MNNMILTVGPGTPASTLMSNAIGLNDLEEDEEGSDDSSSGSSSGSSSDGEASAENAEEGTEDSEVESTSIGVSVKSSSAQHTHSSNDESSDNSTNNNDNNNSIHSDDDNDDRVSVQSMEEQRCSTQRYSTLEAKSSMRHGGCINTACWLTSGWRLSLAQHSYSHNSNSNNDTSPQARAVFSEECPTQLLTSGDDRCVKFWDVTNAMGNVSPIPGPSTRAPFSWHTNSHTTTSNVVKRKYNSHELLPGMVTPLATIQTGHHGNIFHATPIPTKPGNVLTCAADGYLYLSDINSPGNQNNNSPSSTVIISPEFHNTNGENNGLFDPLSFFRAGMCFSHVLLSVNDGLLCSEMGLHRFDLRLAPRNQDGRSVLSGFGSTGEMRRMGRRNLGCKACAVWRGARDRDDYGYMEDDILGNDSNYIFAGGSSGDVTLFDLRMDGSPTTSTRIVQKYRPRVFGADAPINVSGLDTSRDGRELLVSYENDQIYTFPIFPQAVSLSPTLNSSSNNAEIECNYKNGRHVDVEPIPELAAYGGHLNRFTFLKGARYAGPKDEYICTGSDSGHAWIYQRSTGAVASLLKADHSTCNGVIPHPTLPFFVTYGIDSTAKLWRASTPIDETIDDSHTGRATTYHHSPYQKSPLVRHWKNTQLKLAALGKFDNDDDDIDSNTTTDNNNTTTTLSLFPDQITSPSDHRNYKSDDDDDTDEDETDHLPFGGFTFHRNRGNRRHRHPVLAEFSSHRHQNLPKIYNNLRNLPKVLQKNYYTCARAVLNSNMEDQPVKSGLDPFAQRVSLARTCHQADRQGCVWNSLTPWIMNFKKTNTSSTYNRGGHEDKVKKELQHAADLVPNFPSDWLPFDMEMAEDPKEYGLTIHRLYQEVLPQNIMKQWTPREDGENCEERETLKPPPAAATNNDARGDEESNADNATKEAAKDGNNNNIPPPQEQVYEFAYTHKLAWDILLQTVSILKDGGNQALQSNAVSLAAKRYDKAIQYCAVAFLDFPNGNLRFLSCPQAMDEDCEKGGGWTPLLKALVSVRLNLAMAMLKPQLADYDGASEQARQALVELKPFATYKGKVTKGPKCDVTLSHKGGVHHPFPAITAKTSSDPTAATTISVPEYIYQEAKELQAKAYFRLGTAQHSSRDFSDATSSFEKSIQATREACPDKKPESVVIRKLTESKREYLRKKKRHRKKFKFMFSGEEEGEGGNG